ncbi:MAG: plasmid mobilization relaxosome protein MobC [Candidatus Thermoplasmatota archaeon]
MRKRLTVRVTTDERDAICEKASVAGLSMSKYLVKAGLGRQITPPLPDDVRRSIAGFGRNLNQLAHHANSTGTAAEVEVVEALREEVAELLRALSQL